MPFFVFLAVLLFLVTMHDARASALGDFVGGPVGLVVVVPLVLAVLWLAGRALHLAAAYLAERKYSSQVSRAFDTLGSVADGIVATLLAHPPAPANVIEAVRNAGIAQGVAYARQVMPDTLKAIGITDATLAARLGREVEGRLLPYLPVKMQGVAGTLFKEVASLVEEAGAPAAIPAPAAA